MAALTNSSVVRVPLALEVGSYSVQLASAHLQDIVRTDPNRVLLAWGLSGLGFSAEHAIEKHFSSFGAVRKVALALPELERLEGSDILRVAPGYVGFVIMDSELSAERALAMGGKQNVNGVCVCVRNFGTPETPGAAEKPSDSWCSVGSTSAPSGESSPVFSVADSPLGGASPRGNASPFSGCNGSESLPLDCGAVSRRLVETASQGAGQKATRSIGDALRVWSLPH